ncbi:hypothetical protein WDU94_002923 [Cyamophila willieti]
MPGCIFIALMLMACLKEQEDKFMKAHGYNTMDECMKAQKMKAHGTQNFSAPYHNLKVYSHNLRTRESKVWSSHESQKHEYHATLKTLHATLKPKHTSLKAKHTSLKANHTSLKRRRRSSLQSHAMKPRWSPPLKEDNLHPFFKEKLNENLTAQEFHNFKGGHIITKENGYEPLYIPDVTYDAFIKKAKKYNAECKKKKKTKIKKMKPEPEEATTLFPGPAKLDDGKDDSERTPEERLEQEEMRRHRDMLRNMTANNEPLKEQYVLETTLDDRLQTRTLAEKVNQYLEMFKERKVSPMLSLNITFDESQLDHLDDDDDDETST